MTNPLAGLLAGERAPVPGEAYAYTVVERSTTQPARFATSYDIHDVSGVAVAVCRPLPEPPSKGSMRRLEPSGGFVIAGHQWYRYQLLDRHTRVFGFDGAMAGEYGQGSPMIGTTLRMTVSVAGQPVGGRPAWAMLLAIPALEHLISLNSSMAG